MAKIWEAEWWTGRSKETKDLYLDPDKMKQLEESINKNIPTIITTEKDNCHAALATLNNVAGMEYIASIPEDTFDGLYDDIEKMVEALGTKVTEQEAAILAFDKAEWDERLASTLAMTGAKFGEGFLSVFESIGDGLVAVGGFVAGISGWQAGQDAAANFIEKSWSHDIFNFYYNSDLAKASYYTENSGIASIVKMAGETASYVVLGGFLSGLGEVGAKSGNALAKGLGTFAQSTTRVNTLTAAIGGIGQGTETGLKSGMDYKSAFEKGIGQGVVQGSMACLFGKLGEKAQRNAATKESQKVLEKAQKEAENAKAALGKAEQGIADAQKTLDGATKAKPGIESKLTKAQNRVDGLEKSKINNPKKFTRGNELNLTTAKNKVSSLQKELNGIDTKITEAGKNLTAAQERRIAAEKAVNIANKGVTDASEAVKAAQNAKYQGYTDSITKAGKKAGNTVGTSLKNVAASLKDDGIKATTTNVIKNTGQGIKNLGSNIKQGIGSLGQKVDIPENLNPSKVTKIQNAGAQVYNNMPSAVRKGIEGAYKVVSAPVKMTANVGKGMAGAVAQQSTVAGKAAVIGLETAGISSGVANNYANANANASKPQQYANIPNIEVSPSKSFDINDPGNNVNGDTGNNGNTGSVNYNTPNQVESAAPKNPDDTPKLAETTKDTNTKIPNNQDQNNTSTDNNKASDNKEPDNTNSNQTIENQPKPDNPPTISDNTGSSGISHGGSSTSSNSAGNYTFTNSGISASQDEPIEMLTDEQPEENTTPTIPDEEEDIYTIPTDLSGVTSTKKHSSGGGSGVVPILGGLGAAATVGVGAKMYMDHKKNNDNNEDSDDNDDNIEEWNDTSDGNDGILADEWNEDDSNFEYDDSETSSDDEESEFGEI